MNKKNISIAVVAFLAGGVMVASTKQQTQSVQPIVVTKQADLTNWKDLKSEDDMIFTLAGSGFGVCSDSIQAASAGDSAKMDQDTKSFSSIIDKLDSLKNERQATLNKLGY